MSMTSLDSEFQTGFFQGVVESSKAANEFLGEEMVELRDRRKELAGWKLIGRCTVSCVSVLLCQFALFLVPRFFSGFSLLIQLALSAVVLLVVMGVGGRCRRLLGVYTSAPAVVFSTVLFVWAVYFAVIRRDVSWAMDILFTGEVAMLLIGLLCIIASNPGFVTYRSSNSNERVETSVAELEAHNEACVLGGRVRYCRICKAYIKGFDHHCPAFGNCIGQNNHALFMVLLAGFIATEASYVACSSQFAAKSHSQVIDRTTLKTSLSVNLAISTMLFSILQLVWQVLFMAWHIYCICFNIRTDEWVNWKKYPEFQLVIESQPGQSYSSLRFENPYDKGILENVKEFLDLEEK